MDQTGKDPEDSRCVALRDCGKDVTPHLKMCKVVDLRIVNESQLLLSQGQVIVIVLCKLSIQLPVNYLEMLSTQLFASVKMVHVESIASLLSFSLGVFKIEEHHSSITVCPRHRDVYGIGWRSGKVRCSIPSQFAGHKSLTVKGDRGLNSKESAFVLHKGKTLLPVGMREYLKMSQYCKCVREKAQEWTEMIETHTTIGSNQLQRALATEGNLPTYLNFRRILPNQIPVW